MIGKAAVFPTDVTDKVLEERIPWTRVDDESLNDFIACVLMTKSKFTFYETLH